MTGVGSQPMSRINELEGSPLHRSPDEERDPAYSRFQDYLRNSAQKYHPGFETFSAVDARTRPQMHQFAVANPNNRSTSFEHYPKWADTHGKGVTKEELDEKINEIRRKMDNMGRESEDMEGYLKKWTYTQQVGPRPEDRLHTTPYKHTDYFDIINNIRSDMREENEKMSEVEQHRRYVQSQSVLDGGLKSARKATRDVFGRAQKKLQFDIPEPYQAVSKYDLDRSRVNFKKYHKRR
jgi:hypothetical protein